ncbi:hypothetical protein [Mycolicibacterium fortuitum]|nr:hypothetical protein [Mycolicibacterium fortuitum]
MNDIAAPCREREDRDRLSDPDLPDLDDRVGTGPHALDVIEVIAG